jgi:hypothetical protein
MSLSLTKGLCILAFVSISVTSKVRWRNSLCFITKPQQADFNKNHSRSGEDPVYRITLR